MTLDNIEAALYIICASFVAGGFVFLIIGGLHYWIKRMDDHMKGRHHDPHDR